MTLADICFRQICGLRIIYIHLRLHYFSTTLVPCLGDLSHRRYAFAVYVLFLVVAIAVLVSIVVYILLRSGHSGKFSLPSVYVSPFPLIRLLVKMKTFL